MLFLFFRAAPPLGAFLIVRFYLSGESGGAEAVGGLWQGDGKVELCSVPASSFIPEEGLCRS